MEAVKGDDSVDYISSMVRLVYSPRVVRTIGHPWSWPRFQVFMTTAHVGSMHRHRLYEQCGTYDTSYRLVGDYELLLRPRAGLRAKFLPVVTTEMLAGGATDSFAALKEARRAKVATGGRNAMVAEVELQIARVKRVVRRFLTRLQKWRAG